MTTPSPSKRLRPVIRVFVSSTFSDLKQERNALQKEVFPALEKFCLDHGFQFQAIDLRWGVPTEAGLDHRTMRICFDELHRSQEVSPQPNFLILLGDRYGWRPLPEAISKTEYDRLAEVAKSKGTSAETILSQWYQEDKNFLPGSAKRELLCYILQSRQRNLNDGKNYGLDQNTKQDTEVWKDIQHVLWELINEAFRPAGLAERFPSNWDEYRAAVRDDEPELPQIVRFQASATEQEIWCGVLSQADAEQHIFAVHREIANLDTFAGHPRLNDFVDLDPDGIRDTGPGQALKQLKEQLESILGKGNIIRVTGVELTESMDVHGEGILEITPHHLKSLCEEVLGKLKAVIQRQIDEYQPETEQQEHHRFGRERAPEDSFVGRERELGHIATYLAGNDARPLVVYGPSGSGKTALMARAALEAQKASLNPIVRFLGARPRSSTIRSLLTDLCAEFRASHPIEGDLPTAFQQLVQEFFDHLNAASVDKPVLLFLDALDQLDDADGGRRLTWLRSTPLPKHAKLVVSCLSDVPDDDPAGEAYRALKGRRLLESSLPLDELSPSEAHSLLFAKWLPSVGRSVTDTQQAAIEARFLPDEARNCRRPLYLKILFEECRLWPSYKEVGATQLGHNVDELLKTLFDRLSDPSNHGQTVEHALSYIAAARRGLTENEILEVLYSEAMNPESPYKQWFDTSAHHELPADAKRIPIALWSRLRYDLAPYLTEYAAPGGNVLNCYHRQVGDYARERFLATAEATSSRHQGLARYFEGQDYFLESLEEQRARARRLPPTPRPANIRKVDELPWQLLQAAKLSGKDDPKSPHWDAVADLLTDWRFLEAKAEARP